MKIVVLDGYTLNPGDLSWDGIRQFGDLKVYDRTDFSPEHVIKNIGDAEIVFTNKTPVPKVVLEKVPSVKYIGVLATGYNVVDTPAAKALGIIVTNVPTYGTIAVAQFTFALLLELCHQSGDHNWAVKKDSGQIILIFVSGITLLIELAGKTMGLIGFGRIGQATAKIAQAFGLNIITFDRTVRSELESETCKFVSLDELFARSDIISLHCPFI